MPQPPGHAVPAGVDPSAPGSVLAWTQSFGTAFSAVLQTKNVAQRLVRAGYVDLYSLTLGTEDFMNLDADQEEEEEEEQLLPSEARRLAAAARSVCAALGVAPYVEEGVIQAQAVLGGHQLQQALRDRGECPELGSAGTKVGVILGVGGQHDLDIWHAELVAWVANWSQQLAATIQTLRVNPNQELNTLRGGVVARDEQWCGTQVLKALSHACRVV